MPKPAVGTQSRATIGRRGALGLAATLALPGVARAQAEWPSRPIRIIAPYATGGGPDILARLFAQELTTTLGTPVVVENRAGQGGSIGADMVAKAAPDGYTLLLTTTATQSINPALYANIPYDPLRDFSPVGLVARTALLLVVPATLPVQDVAGLVAMAKARPGQLSFATAGAGTMQHITTELFMSRTGTEMVHIPYRGTGQITPDMLAGRVQVLFNSVASVLPLVQDGKLRALGVTTAHRTPAAPEIPTLAESGLPGFEASAWYAVYGPAGLPAPVVARVNAALRQALESPRVKDRYGALGLDAETSTPEELAALTRRDLETWTQVIRTNRITAE